MEKNRLLPLFITGLLCLLCTGCKALPMEAYAPLAAEPQRVAVGETLTLKIPLPVERATAAMAVLSDGQAPCLTADYTAPTLTITGVTPGKAQLQLDFSAGWRYKKSTLTLPIIVELPRLSASLSCKAQAPVYQRGGLAGSTGSTMETACFRLEMGSTLTVAVVSPQGEVNAALAGTASAGNAVVTQEGSVFTLATLRPGEELFTLEAAKEGFQTTYLPCRVEVVAIPAPLALPQGTGEAVQVAVGKTATLPLLGDSELSVESSDPLASATIVQGQLRITGVAEGECAITVHARKENYLDHALTLSCKVTAAPKPRMAPAGTPATPLIADILRAVNAQRAAAGLPALRYNDTMAKAAALRAKEASELRSHIRPDGTECHTVFAAFGLGPYNATGENLAGADFEETGEEVVARWMASDGGHREAILHPLFITTGIGVYYDGTMYHYCQLFAGTRL